MGFDIYGLDPTDEKYKYFRANCWYWRPLWSYSILVTDDLTKNEIEAGSDNSGGFISKETAIKIGKNILERYNSGKMKEYNLDRKKYLLNLPKADSQEKNYIFSIKLALEFANFCQNCGGFEIY